jgi:long-chain acyl-CoA synthetase
VLYDARLQRDAMIDLEEHYRQSAFVKEVRVVRQPAGGGSTSSRLRAIVVPDLAEFRRRKIVNLRELIRFEFENLSLALPPDRRIDDFEIALDPLPGGGAVPADEGMRRLVAAIQARMPEGITVRPDSNLEFDLGLDSVGRVELLASLEQQLGVSVPDEVAQCAMVVSDFAAVFGNAPSRAGAGDRVAPSQLPWDRLLDVRDPGPELRRLATPKAMGTAIYFAMRVAVTLLTRPRVTGLEHVPRKGPFILCPNHQSFIDPFVVGSMLPVGLFRQTFFVGAAEYFQSGPSAWFGYQLNIAPMDPDANLVSAMKAAAFGLRHGRVLVLFPEGERSIDGTVTKFKKGTAILSRHLRVPIVPVAIDGMYGIWPRNRPLAWRLLLPWSGHHVRIAFGKPIPPDSQASYSQQTDRLRETVDRMWKDLRRSPACPST